MNGTQHNQRKKKDSNGGATMRLRALVRKEFYQVARDPSALGIAFVLPVVLLLLFGYGVSLDAENVPVAIVVEHPTADTASLCSGFEQSLYLEPHYFRLMPDAEKALKQRRVKGVVRLRENFSEKLRRPEGATIQVIVNGVDANTARIVQGYVEGIYADWLRDRAIERGDPRSPAPVVLQPRVWFNGNVESRNFLVPGVVAVIMTLIGALLTALLVAREWERGTMEALLVTPVSINEILLGKIVPYFLLGMGGMALSVMMGVGVFGVPLRGSLWVLVLCSALFLLAALGMGLLISAVTRLQFVAAQVAIITTFLPSFILSGFIFDIGSMPEPIRAITFLIPARYFVSILKTVFLVGDNWAVILPNAAALAVMAVFFLGIARHKTPKRLD